MPSQPAAGDADGLANGRLARHERSAGSGVTLVQLAGAVLDSCRYDSFVKACPGVMQGSAGAGT